LSRCRAIGACGLQGVREFAANTCAGAKQFSHNLVSQLGKALMNKNIRNHRKILLATTIAATLMQGAGIVHAQPASGDSSTNAQGASQSAQSSGQGQQGVESITVTGIVGSLGRAIEEKRSNSAIVDTVSAEDVGKFPDNNVAESLQRITGVEITRDGNGEGQYVTVRGLPTDFSLVTVNGMSASSIATASATRTRSFDFSVISPDFISGLEVYKSGRADLDEGGIGANVDVKTVTPFGIGKERIVLSAKAQGEPGEYLNQTLPDLTALYSNIFAHDTLGITAGVDWNQRFAPNEQFTGTSFGTYCISPVAPCSLANTHMNFQQDIIQNLPTSLSTLTGYVSLQWKPVESTVVTLDGLYAGRLQKQTGSIFIEVPQAPYSATGNSYTGAAPLQFETIDQNNVLTTLANPNNWMVDRSEINRIYDTTQNLSLNADTTLDHWQFTEMALYSRSGTTVDNLTPQIGASSFFLPRNVVGGYQYFPGAPVPGFLFDPTFTYSDPNAWGNDEATYAGARSTNELKSAQADVTYTFDDGPIVSIKAGVKMIDQSLPTTTFSWYYNNKTAMAAGANTPFQAAVTSNPVSQNLLAGYSGPGTRLNSMPFINPALWLQQNFGGNYANLIASPYTANQTTSPHSNVEEDSRSAYLLANFKFDNDLMPIHGNVGVRWVDTTATISSNGFDLSAVLYDPSCPHGTKCILIVPPTTLVGRHGGYQKLLPSLNVIGDISDDMQVRLAFSKTMTRPTLGNLPQSPNVSSVANTITTGNPNLQPFSSTNYDASYEWYFQPASVFSVAVYDKEMTNFIQNITSNYAVATQITNNGTTPPVPVPGGTNFTLTEPLNSRTAYVRGAEVDYKQVLDFLPGFWSGFGAELNATYSQGQTDAYTAPANGSIAAINVPAQPFAGLTNLTYNATLFYEKYGFSGLITWNHRGKFTASSTGITPAGLPVNGNKSILTSTMARDEVDAQASYNIDDNYKVFVEASNLLDAPYINYSQIAGISTQYQTGWLSNGRKVSIGLTATW
jgi:iron complex outermembrane receptor protein